MAHKNELPDVLYGSSGNNENKNDSSLPDILHGTISEEEALKTQIQYNALKKSHNLITSSFGSFRGNTKNSEGKFSIPLVGSIESYATKLKNEIGFDTLSSDISSLGKTIEGIYNGWQSKKTMDSTKSQVESMYNRLKSLQAYNADFGDGSADVSEQVNAYKSVLDDWDGITKSYGKFKNADEYNDAVKSQVNYETYNFEENKENIRLLESDLAAVKNVKNQISNLEEEISVLKLAASKGSKDVSEKIKEKEKRMTLLNSSLEKTWSKYGNENNLKSEIYKKKSQYKSAERYKSLQKLLNVINPESKNYDKDFEKYVKKGNKIPWKEVGEATGTSGNGMIARTQYSDTAAAAWALYEHNNPGVEKDFFDNLDNATLYSYFKDEEFDLLAYYIAKDKETGGNQTKEYLDSMEDILLDRKSRGFYEEHLKDNTFFEILYAVPVGLDQFASGIKNLFNTEDDYIPVSAIQRAGQLAREDLADDSIPLWYNFKDGKWENKIFGSSFAQIGYDVLSTTANMAPSILTTIAVSAINPVAGTWAGSTLMGASAAGNAYQEGLNNGMNKGQARLYSTLIGVSETLLSATVSKVFGGKAISNKLTSAIEGIEKSFIRFAANYGWAFASEGLEEAAQEILTPLFENIALGYNKNGFGDIDWSEVAYSFLLGGLSGGNFELIGSAKKRVSNVVTVKQTYNTPQKVQNLLKLGLSLPIESKANVLAKKYNTEIESKGKISSNKIYNLVLASENFIADRLTQLGEKNNVPEIASASVKLLTTNELNTNEMSILANSEYGNEILNTVDQQNPQLQTDGEGGIINDNQSVTGDELSVNRRTNEASVREIREKYFKKTKDNDKRDVSETAEAFAERTRKIGAQSGGKKRILLKSGKSSIAYTPSNSDTPLNKFVKKLNIIGIEAYCSEEVVETNSDGITTIHDEAMTTSKGKIFFCESSKLANKEKADHELVHHAFRMLDDSYLDFEEIILKNLNFESNYYIALCLELNEREYNNQYNVTEDGVSLEDAGAFNSEVAAYVYQMVLNKPDFANEFFSNMFADWDAIVNAVDIFNSKMPIDTNELAQADPNGPANFMPEGENAESDNGEIGLSEPSVKEIHRDPTEQEQNAAIFGKRKDAKQRHIMDVAKKLDSDLTVVFVDPNDKRLSGRAGLFMHDTKTIYLSNDNSIVKMYCELFKHEFVHRLESKKAYQSFKNYLFRNSSAFERFVRAELKKINGTDFDGTREEALKALSDYYMNLVKEGDFTEEYKRNFTAEYAEREMVADFVGKVLFKGKENYGDIAQGLADGEIISLEDTFAEFENLNETERSWIGKVIDAIKDFIASLKGVNQNKRLVEDLEYIEQRLSRVLDSKDTKKAASRAVDGQYSLNKNAKSELHKALYDISYRNEVLLRDETPSIMLSQKGVKNLPMVMKASHIRENVFTEEEAAKLGLKVDGDKHYHGLGEKFFLKIIDGLDNVKEAYRGTKYANIPSRRENYFLLVSEFKDQDGNIINVPVYIEEGAQCNRVYLKSNKIATVFGKDDFRDYISNQLKNKNLVRIKNKSNKISEGGVPLTPAYENIALTDIILNEEDSVKNNISEEDENYSDVSDIKQSFSLTTPAQQQRENFERYENGEITKEEYLEENDRLWGEANEKYGILPQGENADAPIATPRAVAEDKPTERFTRTIIETGALTDEMLEGIEEKVLLGDFAYEIISDDAALKKANRALEYGTAEDIWQDVVNNNKKINKNQIAIGEKLLEKAIKEKDTKKVLTLSSELADIFTRAGQVVQAARLLKKMTGTGRLVSAQRTVKTLNKDLRKKYGEDFAPIKISEKAATRLANAKTPSGIEHAYQEVLEEVAEQMPATFMDKWNAWRYFAMLSNPKTHIRNVVGNAIFVPAVRMRYFLAATMESVNVKDRSQRTKSVMIKKEYIDFAKRDSTHHEVKQLLKGNKYNDKSAIREKQKIFKSEALNFLTEFNSNALEAEDMLFKNKHYIHALAGFLQARGVSLDSVSEEVLVEARIYAVNEAKKATFNDESALANAIQRFGNKNLATNLLVEGVLPFKRTPINIVKRGIEYSPIGLGKTLTKGVYDVKKGKITATEFIDGLASGFTGSTIMLIGMFLANLGCVTGGEKDDDESQFEKLLGKQEYAVEFLGKSYTIDWAAPACIPFFIGVEIINTINEGETFELSQFGNAVWNLLEPMTNLSMLSGIQSVIESARYADSAQTLSAIVTDALTSYFMQGIPSLFGAAARTIDPTQRSWYIDKNDKWLDSTAQTIRNNIQSKVPGLSYTQNPKIDMWGREVSRGGTTERVLENFVSPGYYSEIEYSETNEELKRIFNATDVDVFPNIAAKYFKVNNETKHLTANEYVTYAKAKGEYSFDYLQDFIQDAAYKKLDDKERADVIKNLYEYANAKAKTTVSEYDLMKSYKTVTNWERNGRSAVDYYIYQAIKKQ